MVGVVLRVVGVTGFISVGQGDHVVSQGMSLKIKIC